MTFLVTGASGFVGAAVVRALLAEGAGVRVLVRPSSPRGNIEGLDVDVVEGDLLAPETLAPVVKGCEGVFHVAADYRLWAPEPGPMFRANVEGSRAILLAAAEAGVQRMVYTSSVAVLGTVTGGVGDEETPVAYGDMIGPYKQSKYRAEEAVRDLIVGQGLPCVIANPSTPIGPRDIKPTPTGRVIVEAAAGKIPAYVDTGLNVAHVDDVARGHLQAYEQGAIGERYILGGENLELKQILIAVAERTGRKPPSIKIPHDVILPIAYLAEAWTRLTGGREPFVVADGVRMAKKKMFFSSAKAEQALGYRPRPAIEAIYDAVDWFSMHGYCGTARD